MSKRKCFVENNRVVCCDRLLEAQEESFTKKGISLQSYVDLETGEISKNCVIVKSGDFSKKGIVLNYCPFCGEPISQHILDILSKNKRSEEKEMIEITRNKEGNPDPWYYYDKIKEMLTVRFHGNRFLNSVLTFIVEYERISENQAIMVERLDHGDTKDYIL